MSDWELGMNIFCAGKVRPPRFWCPTFVPGASRPPKIFGPLEGCQRTVWSARRLTNQLANDATCCAK
eukprot:14849307-Alexandrium_andersonii.AAC.1